MPDETSTTSPTPPAVSLADLLLSVLAIVAFALALLQLSGILTASDEMPRLLDLIDLAICGFFLLDFLRSLVRAPDKWRYLRTWGWFDLLSSIPIILVPGSTMTYSPVVLRLARLVRVLRAIRSVRMIVRIARHDRSGAVLTGILLFSVVISVGSCIGVLWAETRPDLPPEVKQKVTLDSANEILWWAVVTCSTVGYGDASPVTSAGRLFAVGLMLVGIGAFATVTSTLGILIGRLRDSGASSHEATHERLASMERQLRQIADRLPHESRSSARRTNHTNDERQTREHED
ncbi:MAG: ion transporter [Phycisphaeraceae bacterium]|nr:ion transporter [Phycisphaeraceae bacterium]